MGRESILKWIMKQAMRLINEQGQAESVAMGRREFLLIRIGQQLIDCLFERGGNEPNLPDRRPRLENHKFHVAKIWNVPSERSHNLSHIVPEIKLAFIR